MKAREHRELTSEELRQRYEDTQKELFNLRLQQSMGQIEKATRIRDLRRDLARMLTIMREKTQKATT
jgi:large subunit ribosomal protein L29